MHANPPVILLIIPNLSPGGAQNVFKQHYEYLSRYYSLHGCVFNWDGTQPTQWPASVTSLDVSGGRSVLGKIRFFLLRIARLRKLKRKLQVSVSISHLEGADFINVLSGIGEKKVLWIHGTKRFDKAIDGWLGNIRKNLLIPRLYRNADCIVTVSRAIAVELAESYPALANKLKTIYNGIDLSYIQEQRMKGTNELYQVLCAKHFVIITHCRLAPQKNIRGLIQLAWLCKNEKIPVKWVILGDGELRNELTKQCDKLSLDYYAEWRDEIWTEDKQVYFLGYQINPFPFLDKAKLYIMSSRWEGFPLALCEALACSLPIISVDCNTGPREILAPGEKVLPETNGPEHAQYGVLMPHLNHESLPIWVKELKELILDDSRLSNYKIATSQRVKDLSIDKSLTEVNLIVKSVSEV
ncbi:MAG: glycosyltransferase [Cyclobacteriaceae bacterium]|nr:glycosyltransferase [Cyclobacteriaceae bacterium]